MPLGDEVMLLYAVSLGMLDGPVHAAGASEVVELVTKLRAHVRATEGDTLDRISDTGLLSDGAKERLEKRIAEALEL